MKQQHETLFIDTCIKCDDSIKSPDGTRKGGMITSVRIDNATIFGTTCWHCFLASPDNN
jgi:hypothetical protein